MDNVHRACIDLYCWCISNRFDFWPTVFPFPLVIGFIFVHFRLWEDVAKNKNIGRLKWICLFCSSIVVSFGHINSNCNNAPKTQMAQNPIFNSKYDPISNSFFFGSQTTIAITFRCELCVSFVDVVVRIGNFSFCPHFRWNF